MQGQRFCQDTSLMLEGIIKIIGVLSFTIPITLGILWLVLKKNFGKPLVNTRTINIFRPPTYSARYSNIEEKNHVNEEEDVSELSSDKFNYGDSAPTCEILEKQEPSTQTIPKIDETVYETIGTTDSLPRVNPHYNSQERTLPSRPK